MEKVRKEVYKQLGREDLLESKYSGYLSGDVADDIANALSYYVKGIIEQPNPNYTYLHLKNKSDASKVIKTLKDVYGLEGTDGGKLFWPSPTIKFDNNQVLEAADAGEITCKNCGWEWNISDGGEKPFVCHKCGHDNEELNEGAKIDLGGAETLEIKELEGGISLVQKSKIGSGKNVIVIPKEYIGDLIDKLKKEM